MSFRSFMSLSFCPGVPLARLATHGLINPAASVDWRLKFR